jgi:predicted AAA+ superfamily ATPase
MHTRLTRAVDDLPRRYLYNRLEGTHRLLGLVGARGVGKTTLLLQYLAAEYGNPAIALYISADHIHVTAFGLYAIAEEHHLNGGKLLCIDEIHKYPNWPQELKNIYDSFPEMRLLVSGSSALQLTKLGHDLSRRLVKCDMKGLSFREYIGFKTGNFPETISFDDMLNRHVQIAATINSAIDPLPLFREYLKTGYYPFWMEGIDEYWAKLQNVINKVLYEDIPSSFSIRPPGIQQMKRLLHIVSTSKPFQLNVSKIAREVGMSRETLYEYLDHLDSAFVVKELWLPNTGRRYQRKPGKLFFENTNLLSLLANEHSPDYKGTLRETFAVNQLGACRTLALSPAADLQDEAGNHFEIGGPSKTAGQLPTGEPGYLLLDGVALGSTNRIPLYLAGFLY